MSEHKPTPAAAAPENAASTAHDGSATAAEKVSSAEPAAESATEVELNTVPAPTTHAQAQLLVADQMWRAMRWPVLGAWVVGVITWTVVGGSSGLWSSLVGGTVAGLSSLGTVLLVRRTVNLNVQMLLVAALGGFVVKMFVLLVTLVLLRAVPGVHVLALGTTMLAVVLVSAAAETISFRRTKIPTLILPAQDSGPAGTSEN
ncbi:hypothetical protein V5P93_006182 [Actinokineospora auranticolor]|uniref:ATP synthase protein I n=1 Tax=Actinokineospora auranticolor TaxID=155976 RepID=A0A2S6GHT0_9PSEU|nr:hypothetical protein [Actinokineospora auranticolor]PPK64779.1 hypothetical protein CLV40_11717 [Actinokineospora auranticolor]